MSLKNIMLGEKARYKDYLLCDFFNSTFLEKEKL